MREQDLIVMDLAKVWHMLKTPTKLYIVNSLVHEDSIVELLEIMNDINKQILESINE